MANDPFDDLFRNIIEDAGFRRQTQYLAGVVFEKAKREALTEFESHPVTREIDGESGAQNISGTLSGIDGVNLWNFIGFDASFSAKPTDTIRKILSTASFRLLDNRISMILPTSQDIFDQTPLPWPGSTGRSWAKGIESGISGLNYFIRVARASSRSGFGLQSVYKARSGARFSNQPYISQIINNFKSKVRKLEGLSI
jgi:hypothetical protein